jgi:hypothetical protein
VSVTAGGFIRAVTGPSRITAAQRAFVAYTLTDLREPTEFRSGAAHGVDTAAAYRGLELWPHARHVLYIPSGHHNHHLVEDWPGERVECAEGRTPAESYRARNGAMVHGINELVAFLFRPTFYRSGEWMTVGIAQRLEVPVVMRVLPHDTE